MSLQPPPEKHPHTNPIHKDPAAEFVRSREVNEAVANRLKALDEPEEQAVPAARRSRLPWGWTAGIGIVLVIVVGAAIYYFEFVRKTDELPDLEFQAAKRGKLVLSVVDKGELEAASNKDISCEVRGSGRGNSIASSIKWLVDEGTRVKEGDVLCLLDDGGLKEQKKTQDITVGEKRSLLIQAKADEQITKIQNESDVKTAENNLTLAIIDLQKYVGEGLAAKMAKWDDKTVDQFRLQGLAMIEPSEMPLDPKTLKRMERKEIKGELERLLEEDEGNITKANADRSQLDEKVKWSDRMLLLDYVGPSQNKSDHLSYENAVILHENYKRHRNQLWNHESRKNILDLLAKIRQAQAAVEVAKKKLEGNMAQARAKVEAAESTLAGEQTKMDDLQKDIDHCTIKSPGEGMVVYHVDERNRFGASTTNVIAINESVRESQKLMHIPDLRQMQVKVKIHEGLVARLTEGLPAQVKIASIEKPFRGVVKDVSAVASSTDWMSSDVKVYPTTVLIHDHPDTLKPGMSAEVTILIEELDNVLRLPVHAVLEVNRRKFCYVRTSAGLEKRFLATGLNNTKFVEIKELDKPPSDLLLGDGEKFGIKEGEQVVMNPRNLADKLGDLHSDAKDPGEGLHIDASKVSKKPRGESKDGDRSKRGPGGKPGGGTPGAGNQAAPGGPGGGGRPGGGGGFQMSEEDRARMQKEMNELKEAMKKAKTPEERKKLFDKRLADSQKTAKERFGMTDEQLQQALPFLKQRLKDELTKDGIEVPD
jgi:HlyD family secretion protein